MYVCMSHIKIDLLLTKRWCSSIYWSTISICIYSKLGWMKVQCYDKRRYTEHVPAANSWLRVYIEEFPSCHVVNTGFEQGSHMSSFPAHQIKIIIKHQCVASRPSNPNCSNLMQRQASLSAQLWSQRTEDCASILEAAYAFLLNWAESIAVDADLTQAYISLSLYRQQAKYGLEQDHVCIVEIPVSMCDQW